jgi:predicted RNase H-like HicB family nuclease
MNPSIVFNVRLPYTIKARKKWHVASCGILDVHSQGETKDKAVENLKEAVSMFLVSCYKRGTLEDVLKECGFSLVQTPKVASVKHQSKAKNFIDVPVMQFLNTSSKKHQNAQCLA